MTVPQVDRQNKPFWFEVDGTRIEQSSWHFYPYRWGGGAFTANPTALKQRLPSPLHPMTTFPSRSMVCVSGSHHRAVGSEPPFLRFGQVDIMAFVTTGEKPAPPLIAGLSSKAAQRYGFGLYMLLVLVTNRVAAEMYRVLMGIPALVADIHHEERLDHDRFVCEVDGRLFIDLTVRSLGRPSTGDGGATQALYVTQGDQVYRLPTGEAGISRSTFGRKAAVLRLGDAPLADEVRRLKLTRSWAAEFMPDRHFWLSDPPERIGPTAEFSKISTGESPIEARFSHSPAAGVEYEIDQGLARLGFEASGTFTGPTFEERLMDAPSADADRDP